jgi:hypothetical protein
MNTKEKEETLQIQKMSNGASNSTSTNNTKAEATPMDTFLKGQK